MNTLLERAVTKAARDERGQSHILGFALCLPLVLIALFFLVGLCWLGWQSVSLDHALYQTMWTMDATKLNQAITTGRPNEAVRDAIAEDWTMLDNERLVVTNASISQNSTAEEQELTHTNDRENLRIERIHQESRFARVQADVTYTMVLPFSLPGIESVVLERHIDKIKQISYRFEVS